MQKPVSLWPLLEEDSSLVDGMSKKNSSFLWSKNLRHSGGGSASGGHQHPPSGAGSSGDPSSSNGGSHGHALSQTNNTRCGESSASGMNTTQIRGESQLGTARNSNASMGRLSDSICTEVNSVHGSNFLPSTFPGRRGMGRGKNDSRAKSATRLPEDNTVYLFLLDGRSYGQIRFLE